MLRRDFVRSAMAAGVWGACGSGLLQIVGRWAAAQSTGGGNPKKLLFIFQRGGNDGINTVIPRGDPDYNTANRPTLYLNDVQTRAADLTGFARLHGAFDPLLEVFNGSAINGIDGMGNVAFIHRVGYANQSRSHFDSQDYWEKGVADDDPSFNAVKTGLFYRHLAETADLTDPTNAFAAASLSGSAMLALQGATPFPNFTNINQFNFLGSAAEQAKMLGTAPSAPGAGDGSGILGLYGGSQLGGRSPSETVHATGLALGGTLQSLAGAGAAYTPENGALYPGGSFGSRLMEAAKLFKRTGVRILGCNIGGHDTHTSQGGLIGDQANNLGDVAEGIRALSLDLQDQWEDVVVVTMTEFGRTSLENGSQGTDHGEASVVIVAGGGVNGGVYNCDASTWQPGDMFSRRGRYLAHNTDYRAVFAEIFAGHFGDTRPQLEAIIPGLVEAELNYPAQMAPLGLFG